MTVSSTTASETFDCDGASVAFPCPFRALSSAEVQAFLITIATGETAELENGVDFTVTNAGTAVNVTVTTTATYSNLYQLRCKRRTNRLQETDYRDNDPFPAESHEAGLDRGIMIAQEQDDAISRTIRVPDGEQIDELPAAEDRASKLAGFDSTGRLIATAPADGSAVSLALLLAGAVNANEGDSMIGWGAVSSIVDGTLTRHTSIAAAVVALGATRATIVVRDDVAVTVNTTIAATTELRVENRAIITVNAGVTLTINGPCDAGACQVFTGAGSVVFGNGSRAQAPRIWFGTSGAVYDTARTLLQTDADTTGPVHAFEDNNTVNFTHTAALNFNAYASFDSAATISGAGTYDHSVGYQMRQTYTGSGSIGQRWDGFNWLVTHTGLGTATTVRGFHAENPLGAGVINFLAGFLCEYLDRGAETHGFFSATPLNTVRVGAGKAAQWTLQGNGQTGGFGLVLQSAADSSARILQTANEKLRFGTNNTDYGYITADGRWKFSTTVADALSANQAIEVTGVGGATFKATGIATVGNVLNWHAAAAGDNLLEVFYTDAAATLRGSIDYNRAGNAVRYNTTSDLRLKENVVDAPAAGDLIDAIRVRSFDWKESGAHTPYQFIAQELHAVFPDAVRRGDDGEEVSDVWAVDPSKLIGLLIKEVQSLRARLLAAGIA